MLRRAGPGRDGLRTRVRGAATPTRLLLLAGLVVLATLIACATAVGTVQSQRHTAVTLAARTSPTVVDAARARALLAGADLVAARSLLPPGSWGPPDAQFQENLKTAGQALARAADTSTAGEADRAQVQAVNNGLLVVYMGDIYSAAAAGGEVPVPRPAVPPPAPGGGGAAATDDADLTVIYLAYASDLMREPTGILASVAEFQQRNSANLPAGGTIPWALLGGHLAAAAVLLGLLVWAQVFLRRRFRRVLSLGLIGAAAAVVLLAGGLTVLTVRTGHDIDRGARETAAVACLWQAREAATLAEQDRTVGEYVAAGSRADVLAAATDLPAGRDGAATAPGCAGQDTRLPGTLAGGGTDPAGGNPAGGDQGSAYRAADERLGALVGQRAAALDGALDDAVRPAGLPWAMVAGAVVLLALGGYGFWPRVREYRS